MLKRASCSSGQPITRRNATNALPLRAPLGLLSKGLLGLNLRTPSHADIPSVPRAASSVVVSDPALNLAIDDNQFRSLSSMGSMDGMPTKGLHTARARRRALDWRPKLKIWQELVAASMSAGITAACWAYFKPIGFHPLYIICASLVYWASNTNIRAIWLEHTYQTHMKEETELGEPDSLFLTLPGGPPGIRVHAKSKRGPPLKQSSEVSSGYAATSGGSAYPSGGTAGTGIGAYVDATFDQYDTAGGNLTPSGGSSAASVAPAAAVHWYHGFGGNLFTFGTLQEQLAKKLPGGLVTAHDMPGFGLTTRPKDTWSYSLATNGEIGRLVMDHELALHTPGSRSGPTRVKRVLMGHSVGSICAVQQALENPDEVDALVLIAPAVRAGKSAISDDIALSERPRAGMGPDQNPGYDPVARRYLPVVTGTQAAGSVRGEERSGGGGWNPFMWVGRVIRGAFVLLAIAMMRVLRPLMVAILRRNVRSREFWEGLLQRSFYDQDMVTEEVVDEYSLPQLVRGWETGLCKFYEARFMTTRPSRRRRSSSSASSRKIRSGGGAPVIGGDGGTTSSDDDMGASPTGLAAFNNALASTADYSAGVSASKAIASMSMDEEDGISDPDGGAGSDLVSRLAALMRRKNMPVLIIHGKEDRMVPVSNSQRLIKALGAQAATCELVVLERTGHVPHEERPALLAELVSEFVQRDIQTA